MERRCYPAGALERVQELELSMLLAVDGICRELGLTYFVDAGTCLGAVRHQGFIPWDDDTDIGMPIADYRRFLEEAPALLPRGMSLHTMENTAGFSALWAKVFVDETRFLDEGALEARTSQGIFLDVFPYVPLSGPLARATRQMLLTGAWQKVSYLRHIGAGNVPEDVPHRLPKAAACVAAHALLSRVTTDSLVRACFEYAVPKGGSGEFWANPCSHAPFPFPGHVLFEPVELSFCGHLIFGPHDARAYLAQLYGDYLTLPAPERRHTHTPCVLDFGDGIDVMAR